MKTTVKIKRVHPQATLPAFQREGDAGADLTSVEDYVLMPGETKAIDTGFKMELERGWEAQIRSRSGLAAKHSVFCLNSPGTIDCFYFGNVMVILHNANKLHPFEIKSGDRIAQMVVKPTHDISFLEVNEINMENDRGGGLGSTGK